MDIGSDLYFHIMKKNWAWGSTLDPHRPSGGITTQNIGENLFGHVTHQSKAHEKLFKYAD